MHRDFDFHPHEDTVRIFTTPPAGMLRFDDEMAIAQAVHEGGIVLRHYAFRDHWFKVNVTTDLSGNVVELAGGPEASYAFNCDIATPMERDGDDKYAVDLFTDVLVRADAVTYFVGDEDEFDDALRRGLLSPREATGARAGLRELVEMIEGSELLPWLEGLAPFGPCSAPPALPVQRRAVPDRLKPKMRGTW